MKLKSIKMTPPQLLIFFFSFFIFAGALLLKLPIATYEPISWIDAFFTITSATTVTGLTVIDTGTTYTLFGQTIIMLWIQIGGLGIMSFAVLIFIMLGKKISFRERVLVQQSLNQTSFGGVIRLVLHLFLFAFIIEFIAVIFLAIRWIPEFGIGKGLYFSCFHAVSAFNNAGFGLLPDNLMKYAADPLINIVITLLFIIGGIGFTVLIDLRNKKSWKRLSLHSKLMISGTVIINAVSMLVILFLEFDNPKTLGLMDWSGKLWSAYFQGVSPRTAGFNTIDMTVLKDSTAFYMMFLMFVGAGSASTGGGIKLTTFLIILLSVFTYLKGKEQIHVFKRAIDHKSVFKALAISMISMLLIFVAVFIMTITEKAPFVKIIFEVISAFGTVGLTMGLTFELSFIGKLVIIFMMSLGKLGPLTLAFSLARRQHAKIRYPQEEVLTG